MKYSGSNGFRDHYLGRNFFQNGGNGEARNKDQTLNSEGEFRSVVVLCEPPAEPNENFHPDKATQTPKAL
jgi:hypothetical protein